jgi:hypothetical protein
MNAPAVIPVIKPMPLPSEKSAPKWDGRAKTLLEFLRSFEAAATQARLTGNEKVEQLGQYCLKYEDQDLLETLSGFAGRDWAVYRASILEEFPGADPETKFSLETLELLVRKTRKSPTFRKASAYAEYNQRFLKQATWLQRRNLLSDEEKARMYLKGFPTVTRDRIERSLEVINDQYQDPANRPTFADIRKAVKNLMKRLQLRRGPDMDDEEGAISDLNEMDSDSDDEDKGLLKKVKAEKRAYSPIRAKEEVKHKEEPQEDLRDLLLRLNAQNQQPRVAESAVSSLVMALAQALNNFQVNNTPNPGRGQGVPNLTPQGNPGSGQARRFEGCTFCGSIDGHYMRSCLICQSYEEKGFIKKDPTTNRFVMGTGEQIPSYPPNTPLKTRIDAHMKRAAAMYQAFAASVPVEEKNVSASTLLIETSFEKDLSVLTQEIRNVDDQGFQDSLEELNNLVAAIETQNQRAIKNTHPMKTRSKPAENTDSNAKSGGATKEDPPVKILKRDERTVSADKQSLLDGFERNKQPPINRSKEISEKPKVTPANNASGPLRYGFKSPAENPQLMDETLAMLKEGRLSQITPAHILSVSPYLRAQTINYLRGQKVEVHSLLNVTSVMQQNPKIVGLKSLPLREVEVSFQGGIKERGVLDDGSSIIVMRKDLWEEIPQMPLLRDEAVTMECADASVNQTLGMIKDLPIKIGHIVLYVQAQVVQRAPYRFLLGRPFSALVGCVRNDYPDGSTLITITDPNNPELTETIPTVPRVHGNGPPAETWFQEIPVMRETTVEATKRISIIAEPDIAKYLPVVTRSLANDQTNESVGVYKKYKPVAKKVKPVPATLPEEFRVVRRMPHDPLASLPKVEWNVSAEFKPGKRLTVERWETIETDLKNVGFLNNEEIKILREILKTHEDALAWDESMRGTFNPEYFPPVTIPVVEHEPWVEKNFPIPAGIRQQVIEDIKTKIKSGTYEGSSSSYRSRFFVVAKKNGKLRIVHDLQPLNRVTIRDSGVPPVIDEIIEETCGRQIYSLLDALVGYDHQPIEERSRDLTTFQSPLGLLRLTALPMGWSNSVSIFHGHITFVLQDEIPEKARPFIDDVTIKGPRTTYSDENGQPETLAINPQVRRFVAEHHEDFNRIMHRIRLAGITISAKKLFLCVPEVTILGHRCTAKGRIPDNSHVKKVLEWPACRNLTEVRGFLGVCNLMRIFIPDYAKRANALTHLTRKNVEFEWGEAQENAFEDLKEAITTAPVLKPLDYDSDLPVYLAVDSSPIAAGWLLSQDHEDKKRHPIRYGSRVWKQHEALYSQAKRELLGVLVGLKGTRRYTIGVKKLIVEVDAEYIKGMLNNPDLQPNATLNRWIALIQLYDFELRHIPAEKHKAPDGLSRRPPTEEDLKEAEEESIESWIDEKLELFSNEEKNAYPKDILEKAQDTTIPITEKSEKEYEDLKEIEEFLKTLKFKSKGEEKEEERLTRKATRFFVREGKLYQRDKQGNHQRVINKDERLTVLRQIHDGLGHKGFFPCRSQLYKRFWWPNAAEDLKWYLKTCQVCQERNIFKVHLPPIIPEPATLFGRIHVDTMFMPKARGFRYIVQAVCSLSGWPEAKALTHENGRTIGEFLMNQVISRYGAVREIVTDNGKPFINALEYLSAKYKINHIRISPYNSQAQGIVERAHYGLRESLVKACGPKINEWPLKLNYALWAQRITTRKGIGYSPYYMVYGTEPVFPFDIEEATYLAPNLNRLVPTTTLIAERLRQLEKRSEDLAKMKETVWIRRRELAGDFLKKYEHTVKDYDFQPGRLVLVRNSGDESGLKNKYKPRYLGPYVVVHRNFGGAYKLAEMDGTVSELKFAAKRLIPYHLRSRIELPKANEAIGNANKREISEEAKEDEQEGGDEEDG